MKRLILIFFLIGLSIFGWGQNKNQLILQSGIYQPTGYLTWNRSASEGELSAGTMIRILQFDPIPVESTKLYLNKLGISLLDYLPENSYFARIPSNFNLFDLKKIGITAIIDPTPEMRMSRTLLEQIIPAWAVQNDSIKLQISFYQDVDIPQLIEKFRSSGFLIDALANTSVVLQVPIKSWKRLFDVKEIMFVDVVSEPSKKDDLHARNLHRSSFIHSMYPSSGFTFDGNGVVIALGDDGLVGPHIDFNGRLTNVVTTNSGNHGDMCAGILGGAGNKDVRAAGMASGAQIFNYPIAGYGHILNAPTQFQTTGQVISSTSYSQTCNGGYTSDARIIDQQLSQNNQLMHVFSAGNQGQANCNFGAGVGWGTITGGYKSAKQVMAVGNTNYLGIIDPTSSRGPSSDGRIKPDICAQGTDQLSTDPNNQYALGGGTSAAAPGIAGIAAQLYQAYRFFNHGNNPDGALLKAILLNTAEDLGTPGPDFTYGFGRVNAYRAYQSLIQKNYWDSSLVQNDTVTHEINVPPGTRQIKLMLYWPDTAGTPNAAKALVNDLDFVAADTLGNIFHPLILNPTKNANILSMPAVPGVDTLNNVEQIVWVNPPSGPIRLFALGKSIPMGPQKFYFTYCFQSDSVHFTYPKGLESFSPGTQEVIHWDAFDDRYPFDLYYSVDSGNIWKIISTNISPKQRYFEWKVPVISSTEHALLKIVRNGIDYVTDTTWNIINRPNGLRLDWQCTDSLMISWNAVAGTKRYIIHELGAKKMDSIGESFKNRYVIHRNAINRQNTWFAITAVTELGSYSERSIAFNKSDTLLHCPQDTDLAALSIITPWGGSIPSCQIVNPKITVAVKNEGFYPINSFIIQYNYNTTTPAIIDTIFRHIDPFDTIWVHSSIPATMNQAGLYHLQSQVYLTGDSNHTNDTCASQTTVYPSNMATIPYFENFDGLGICGNTSDCGQTVCSLAASNGGIRNEISNQYDDCDFRNTNVATPTASTGPDFDHSTGLGNYIYFESSNCFNKKAKVLSPCIDLTGISIPKLEFWYHMYGNSMGKLTVDIMADGNYFENVYSIQGDQGNIWKKAVIDLSNFKNQTIVVVWNGESGNGSTSDMAIDDIQLFNAALPPKAQIEITQEITCKQIPIQIIDNSTNDPTNRKWLISPSSFQFLQGSSDTSLNPSLFFTQSGSYSIQLWVANKYGQDSLVLSNSVTVTDGLPLPMAENFPNVQSPPKQWNIENPDNSNTWATELVIGANGTPTFATRVDNFNYSSVSERDYLISPPIHIPAGKQSLLTFYHAYSQYSSTTNDTLLIEISADCGETFDSIIWSKSGNTLATTATSNRLFKPTSATQWRLDTLDISFLAGKNIRFRFTNITDYGNNLYLDSILLDTLRIIPNDGRMVRLSGISAGSTIGNSTYFSGLIKNEGSTLLNNIILGYQVNGMGNYNSIASGIIQPGDSALLPFTTPFSPSQAGVYQICVYPKNIINDTNRNNDTLCINVNSNVSVHQIEQTISLYPNPTNTKTGIYLEGENIKRIQIFNSQGTLIWDKATFQEKIWIPTPIAGIYFIRWFDFNDATCSQKFIVE